MNVANAPYYISPAQNYLETLEILAASIFSITSISLMFHMKIIFGNYSSGNLPLKLKLSIRCVYVSDKIVITRAAIFDADKDGYRI